MRSTSNPGHGRRRLVLAGVLAVVAVGLVAVALVLSGGSDGGGSAERSTTTAAGSDDTDPGTAPADPDDQVVWQERAGGGLVPDTVGAAEVPTTTIYADGRIFVADRDLAARYDHPVPLRSGSVPADVLRDFLAGVADSGLFAPDVDFGAPGFTDLATTTVRTFLDGEVQQVEVYALEASFEEDLSGDEVDRRNDLRELLAEGLALAEDAEPWTPDRVRITDLGTIDVDPAAPDAPVAWPGPAFATFGEVDGGDRCLVAEGEEAATVFQAAIDNPGIAFVADAEAEGEAEKEAEAEGEGDGQGEAVPEPEVHEVGVAALLPAEVGCPA